MVNREKILEAIEQYGITNDTNSGAFVLPDGRLLKRGLDKNLEPSEHEEMARELGYPSLRELVLDTGLVRYYRPYDARAISLTVGPNLTENQAAEIESLSRPVKTVDFTQHFPYKESVYGRFYVQDALKEGIPIERAFKTFKDEVPFRGLK